MPPGPYVRRIALRAGLVSFLANLVGAGLAFFFLTFLTPERTGRPFGSDDVVSSAVFGVYLVFTFVTGAVTGNRAFVRVSSWATDPRAVPPTDEDRDLALSLPAQITLRASLFWVGGALVFMTLNIVFDNSWREVARVGTGILVAGASTAALTFLLVERAVRPLIAQALAGRAPEEHRRLGVRTRLMLSWALGSGMPLLSISAVMATNRSRQIDLTVPVVFLALVGAAGGWLMMLTASGTIAAPLDRLRRTLAKVERGDLDVAVEVDDGGEVGRLQAGFNRMVAGLREREQIADLFGRHVGPDVARQAMERRGLGGEQRQASAMFVDLKGSTRLAIERPAGEVVALLNDFFASVVQAVAAEGGWVNKFQGDGALCVFGAIADQPDHAARALRAARRIRRALTDLRARHPELDAGIGVSTGLVVAGNVGAEDRYEFTVIGDPVNEAARLTEAAKGEAARVLVSRRAVEAAAGQAGAWAEAGTFELRGRVGATRAYRPEADS